MPNNSPVASAMASLLTTLARTSLPPAFAWSHAYSFATSFANFFAMPAVPDAATGDAERSSEADDDNETCVATGATGATTVNERPGPMLRVERLERAVDLGCCGAHFKELRRPLNYYL